MHPDVVALEAFHEGLRYAVAFWAGDWREARHQIDRLSERPCRLRGLGAAIVG